jgi:formate hydrogenlyase transcriptional activator
MPVFDEIPDGANLCPYLTSADTSACEFRDTYEARILFQRLLAELSARLLKAAAPQLDREIDSCLRELCARLGLDRADLWESSPSSAAARMTHVYQAEFQEPRPALDIPEAGFPWIGSQMQKGETVVMEGVDHLPPEAVIDRASMIRVGTKACVIVPLSVGGRVFGGAGFDDLSKERAWSPETVDGLKLMSDVFASALDRRRIDDELRFSEARLSLAADSAQAGIWELDARSAQVWGNKAALAIHGLHGEWPVSLDDVIATIHPDDRDAVLAHVQTAVNQTKEYAAEYRIVAADGSIRWVLARGRLHDGMRGEAPRLLGVTIDLSERRLSEEQLRAALAENQRLQSALKAENVFLRQEVERGVRMASITGESAAVRQVLQQAERVAVTGSTVLLLGETGTGKERFAAFIHGQSPRRDHLMVRVNCAAIPATLMESELFGREKGAYTGALSRQVGRFELAHGSTIFLDEIGDLPAEVQVKLLRVLQERQIERLGSPTPINVDVRIIAATHQNLEEAVQAGRFREDLYYRLNVFPIRIPPLRERRDDIAPLAREIIAELEKTMGRHFEYVSKASMESLTRYDWPGNVRELRNVLERAMILGSGPTLSVALPSAPAGPAAAAPVAGGDGIADVERQHILTVLEKTGWRIRGEAGAAKSLGLKPTTLEHRMVKLGITRPGKP